MIPPSTPIRDPSPSTGIGAILLAAGASSRLGTPKQLVTFRGISLLRHAACSALEAGFAPIMVVTGAYEELVRPELQGLDVAECWNAEWKTGMASSVRCGLTALLQFSPDISAAALMLCDQPLVDGKSLSRLRAEHLNAQKVITASGYGGTFGVPAIFAREFFPELLDLRGQEGAKRVLQRHRAGLHIVPLPAAECDVDTLDDVAHLSGLF